MSTRVLAIVGSYRKGGIIDQAVGEILASCKENGAEVTTIHLLDKHVEFCTNCRACMQVKGPQRGPCVLKDEMESILEQIDHADTIVFGAPVNFFNVNAITRRFIERLVVYGYWPWGQHGPANRIQQCRKKAILVTSTAMPALLGLLTTGAMRVMKFAAKLMGARPVGELFIGMASMQPRQPLSPREIKIARKLGQLASR